MNTNVVVLLGNAVDKPELKYVKVNDEDVAVAKLTLAVNRVFKKSDSSKGKSTAFVPLGAWSTGAELMGKLIDKGTRLLVQGSIKQDNWTNAEGQKRSRLLVRVDNFVNLTPKPSNNGDPDQNGTSTHDGSGVPSATPVVVTGTGHPFGDKYAWLEQTCWRLRLEYHRNSTGVTTYSVHATFDSPQNPLGSLNIMVDDPTLGGVLDKAINEVQKKL